MGLGETLERKMPIGRVVAECGECGIEFFDSKKGVKVSPRAGGNTIELEAEAHKTKTGHDDLQVEIDKPTPRKPIDATITVNNE